MAPPPSLTTTTTNDGEEAVPSFRVAKVLDAEPESSGLWQGADFVDRQVNTTINSRRRGVVGNPIIHGTGGSAGGGQWLFSVLAGSAR